MTQPSPRVKDRTQRLPGPHFHSPTWAGSSPMRREPSILDRRPHATHGGTKWRISWHPETLAHFALFHTRRERQQRTKRQCSRWSGGAVVGPLADERRSPMGERATVESSCGDALSQDPESRWRVEVAARDLLPRIWGDLSPASGGDLEAPLPVRWVQIWCDIRGGRESMSGGGPTEWSTALSTDELQPMARTDKHRDLFLDHVVNDDRRIRWRWVEFLVLT
jgi:hypothetical protein